MLVNFFPFYEQLSVQKDVTMVEHVQGQVFVVVQQVGQEKNVEKVSTIYIMYELKHYRECYT